MLAVIKAEVPKCHNCGLVLSEVDEIAVDRSFIWKEDTQQYTADSEVTVVDHVCHKCKMPLDEDTEKFFMEH